MAQLEEQLNAILSDPEAMSQIMGIAQALTGSGKSQSGQQSAEQSTSAQEYVPVEDVPPQETASDDSAQPDIRGLMDTLSALGGSSAGSGESPLAALESLGPKLLSAAVRLFSEYNASDDRKIALLSALRPFLKEERYAKVDKAMRIARLSRVIRVAFQLFKKDGGEVDV